MLKRAAICLPIFAAVGCDGGSQAYPFIGKWQLERKSGENSYLCDFMSSVAVSRKHVVTPYVFGTIESVKRDGKRWIVEIRDKHQPGPPAVFNDVTASTMVVEDVRGTMQCAMKKVGECANDLCS